MKIHLVLGLMTDQLFADVATWWTNMMLSLLPAGTSITSHKWDSQTLATDLAGADIVVSHSFGGRAVEKVAAQQVIPHWIACDPVNFDNPMVPNTVGFSAGKCPDAVCYYRGATEMEWSGSFISGPGVLNIQYPVRPDSGKSYCHDMMRDPYAYVLGPDGRITTWDLNKPQNLDLLTKIKNVIGGGTLTNPHPPTPTPTPTPTGFSGTINVTNGIITGFTVK